MDRKQVSRPAPAPNKSPSSPELQHEELPPAYTTSHTSPLASTRPIAFTVTSIPSLDYASYRPASSIISADHTTITTSNRLYSKDARALADFIRQQASLPPRPSLRVRGTFNAGLSTEFDVKINLLPYLYRPGDDAWNYLSVKSSLESNGGEGSSTRRPPFSRRSASSNRSLDTWCQEFVKETSSIKTFTLTRAIINFDISAISGLVRNAFADLKYRGQLEITLDTAFSKVVVDNQPTKGASAFFRPLVSAFVGSKDYDIVTAVWPWARSGPNDTEIGESREFATLSEVAWWREWETAVTKAAMEKRIGWVTNDDKIEAVMTGWASDIQMRPWGSFDRG